jgi:hypothetical protein
VCHLVGVCMLSAWSVLFGCCTGGCWVSRAFVMDHYKWTCAISGLVQFCL